MIAFLGNVLIYLVGSLDQITDMKLLGYEGRDAVADLLISPSRKGDAIWRLMSLTGSYTAILSMSYRPTIMVIG